MDLYLIAHQHIYHAMREQFREERPLARSDISVTARPGIVTTVRTHLSAELRALAASIEPRSSLTQKSTASPC